MPLVTQNEKGQDQLLVDGFLRKYSKYSILLYKSNILSYQYYHFECELLNL